MGREERVANPVTYAIVKIEGGLNLRAPSLALSPDGRRLAYTTDEGGDLYIRSLNETSATRIERNRNAMNPFFSADGQWLGFIAGDRLMKVAATGSDPSL